MILTLHSSRELATLFPTTVREVEDLLSASMVHVEIQLNLRVSRKLSNHLDLCSSNSHKIHFQLISVKRFLNIQHLKINLLITYFTRIPIE